MKPTLNAYSAGAREIILAAERLIAKRGLEGASSREILRAAGQANKSAITYHFGSKQGLVKTIFYLRQGQIDEMRGRRCAELAPIPRDPELILGLLLLPVLDAFKGRERETFANLALQLILAGPDPALFAIENEPPFTRELRLALRECYAALPDDVFLMRLSLAVALFLQGIVQREHMKARGAADYAGAPYFWDELVRAAFTLIDQDYPPRRHPSWTVPASETPPE